ncbi:hypothetical protein CFT13S00388_02465 [Campylobacter fetus subsp. testudinum]|uniref:hypothetical protein n=1 Tax=Campylobacter fetus TaxID=196 RepID=UPI0008187D9F|nr:hypothetical protein [Campylobacter fetus]OCR88051.1 hypothetical protein CFT13S00388_02465 [Campylobacter fetus subsp. testudinum]
MAYVRPDLSGGFSPAMFNPISMEDPITSFLKNKIELERTGAEANSAKTKAEEDNRIHMYNKMMEGTTKAGTEALLKNQNLINDTVELGLDKGRRHNEQAQDLDAFASAVYSIPEKERKNHIGVPGGITPRNLAEANFLEDFMLSQKYGNFLENYRPTSNTSNRANTSKEVKKEMTVPTITESEATTPKVTYDDKGYPISIGKVPNNITSKKEFMEAVNSQFTPEQKELFLKNVNILNEKDQNIPEHIADSINIINKFEKSKNKLLSPFELGRLPKNEDGVTLAPKELQATPKTAKKELLDYVSDINKKGENQALSNKAKQELINDPNSETYKLSASIDNLKNSSTPENIKELIDNRTTWITKGNKELESTYNNARDKKTLNAFNALSLATYGDDKFQTDIYFSQDLQESVREVIKSYSNGGLQEISRTIKSLDKDKKLTPNDKQLVDRFISYIKAFEKVGVDYSDTIPIITSNNKVIKGNRVNSDVLYKVFDVVKDDKFKEELEEKKNNIKYSNLLKEYNSQGVSWTSMRDALRK